MKILANDGISKSGIALLEENGFTILTTKVAQNQLINFINEEQIEVLLIGNITKISRETIQACPSLKLIGKEGIDMKNIAVDFAIDKGIKVVHTPKATANSLAELVFAHLLGMARFLHISNREMPLEGDTRFNELKKAFSQGVELRGKTLGIIGFGSIGQEVAKIAIGLGMNIIATDTEIEKASIDLIFFNNQKLTFEIETQPFENVLTNSDFITLHVQNQNSYILTSKEFLKMRDGVGIVNISSGKAINEVDLINAIENKKIKFVGLDVFENEPTPEIQLLMNPEISLSPNIGSSTIDAHEKSGVELAQQIVNLFKKNT